jgi:hypothetical protein
MGKITKGRAKQPLGKGKEKIQNKGKEIVC